jgi:CysZ protein
VIGSFGKGTSYALRGAAILVRTPSLWPLVIAPFLLSLAAMIGLVWAMIAMHDRALAWLTPSGWLGDVVGPVVTLLYWLIVPVLVWFLYLPIASLIAGPFNEAIAEGVERRVLGKPGAPFSALGLARDLGLTVVHELRRFVRWAVLALAVLALSVILPGVGSIIALAGGAYIAARFAAWDALDYTLSRRAYSYDAKQAFLRQRRALALGFGGAIAGLLLVPVLGALAMPSGAAGGALLVHDALDG